MLLQATGDQVFQPFPLVAVHQPGVIEIQLGLSIEGPRDGPGMRLHKEDDVQRFQDFDVALDGVGRDAQILGQTLIADGRGHSFA